MINAINKFVIKQKKKKKGAVSLETLIVSAIIITLTVGLLIAFSRNIQDSGVSLNNEINETVNERNSTSD